jgi:hypothetical protein
LNLAPVTPNELGLTTFAKGQMDDAVDSLHVPDFLRKKTDTENQRRITGE